MDLIIGFIFDLILGDPYDFPHPIRWVGSFISFWDKLMYKEGDSNKSKYIKGMSIVIIVVMTFALITACLVYLFYKVNISIGIIFEGIISYYMIAPRSLKDESMKVYNAIESNNVEQARYAVSMIVGRDTKVLDKNGIIKAAVETVAENTSDGVTAPIMYMAFGGSIAGIIYKCVNTCDSMLGYKNDKYLYFGRFAAKLDDILNYIPSRLTALAMIVGAFLIKFDYKNAFKIWKRDRRNHASPNSAQTESVCAGALNLMLAGDAYYFGKLYKKKTIGDKNREIENEDIVRANKLMYATTYLVLAVSVIIRFMLFNTFYR